VRHRISRNGSEHTAAIGKEQHHKTTRVSVHADTNIDSREEDSSSARAGQFKRRDRSPPRFSVGRGWLKQPIKQRSSPNPKDEPVGRGVSRDLCWQPVRAPSRFGERATSVASVGGCGRRSERQWRRTPRVFSGPPMTGNHPRPPGRGQIRPAEEWSRKPLSAPLHADVVLP